MSIRVDFLAIRHGQTEAGAKGIILGHDDSPLTKKGKIEIIRTSKKLPKIELLISSDLGRATETSHLIRMTLGFAAKIKTMPEFRERNYGSLQGKTKDEIIFAFPELPLSDDRLLGEKIPELELYDDFLERIKRGLRKIYYQFRGKNIAIITHGGVIRAMYFLAKKNVCPKIKNGSIHYINVRLI